MYSQSILYNPGSYCSFVTLLCVLAAKGNLNKMVVFVSRRTLAWWSLKCCLMLNVFTQAYLLTNTFFGLSDGFVFKQMFSLALLTVAMTVCRHKSKLLYMFGCERCIGELISFVFTELESSWPETDFPRRRVLQYGIDNQTIDTPRAGGNQTFYSICIS